MTGKPKGYAPGQTPSDAGSKSASRLKWKRSDFVEYDVEADPVARSRMRTWAAGQRNVPLLVENGKVVQAAGKGAVAL